MNHQDLPLKTAPVIETASYSGFSNLIRSWFWRFYDHLLSNLLINLGWFLTCFGVGWTVIYFGWLGSWDKINLLGVYGLYLLEAMFSIGWAFLVFKLFNEGKGSLKDYWLGVKKYFWKAMGTAALSGFVAGLGLYNLRFYFHLQSPHRFIDLLLAGFIFWILLFWTSAALLQWPILFFQNPPFSRIYYRSCLLVLGHGLISLGILLLFSACFLFFNLAPFLWYFIGPVFFFSFQCVALEKHFLKYRITYEDKPLEELVDILDRERQRGWRDFLRPWENR